MNIVTAQHKGLKLVFVHGFNVVDGGERSIDRLAQELETFGYTNIDTDGADYGFFGFLMVRFNKWSKYRKSVYARLEKAFEDASVILTHSNGAWFSTATLYGMKRPAEGKRILVNYSAAMNRDTEIPHAVDMQYNFCTKNDWLVRLSALIPFHAWGAMGSNGYCGAGPNKNLFFNEVKRHSGWFHDDHREVIAEHTDLIIERFFAGYMV